MNRASGLRRSTAFLAATQKSTGTLPATSQRYPSTPNSRTQYSRAAIMARRIPAES
jgi:hypothetical protein